MSESGNVLPIKIVLDKSAVAAQAAGLRAELARTNKAIAADATASAREEAKGVAEASKVKADATGRARDEAGRFVETSKEGWGAVETGIMSAGKAVGGFALGMAGLSSASSAVSAVVEHFREVNRSVYQAGEFVQDYRKALLELAALKGQLGKTTKTLGEDIAFRSETLQSKEDSIAFQNAALGVGESAIDKPGMPGLITRDEFTKAMKFGGAFQAAEGGSADTHATLIGLIPQLLGRRTTGEEVARKEAQLYQIFQPGGASFTSLAGQYGRLAPLVQSKTYDPMQAAALLSAFSTTNREGAGDEVQQFTRATVGNIDRSGKPRIKGAEPIGDYFADLGIDKEFLKRTASTDLPFAIGGRIGGDVRRAEDAAKARGEEFSRLVYLKHKGFANQEEINSLSHFIGMTESGAMANQFLPLARDEALPTLEQATEKAREFQRTDPRAQGRKAELAADAANVAVGAGGPELIMNLQKVAFSRLKADRRLSGEYGEDVQDRMGFELKEILFADRSRVQMESQRMLLEQADKVGVPRPAVPGYFDPVARLRVDKYMGRDAMVDFAAKIQGAGGTAVPGLEQVTGAAQKSLGRAAEIEGAGAGAGAGADAARTNALLEIQNAIMSGILAAVRPAAPVPLLGPPLVTRR